MKLITNPYSFDSVTIREDAHGRATVKAKIMKVGQLRYLDQSGKEFFANINLDDLKRAKRTVALKPITIKHPQGMLTDKDIKLYQEGISADNGQIEEIDGETWLTNDIVLTTETAKNVAREGKLGISAGYYREAVPNGANIVDFKDIDINHIAIGCDNPRANGAELYSLDSSDSDIGRIFELDIQQTKTEVGMEKRILNAVKGQGFSLDEAPIEYDTTSSPAIEKLVNREKALVGQFESEIEKAKQSFDEQTEDLKAKNGELLGETKALKAEIEKKDLKISKSISMDDAEAKLELLADAKNVASKLSIEIGSSLDSLGIDEKIAKLQRMSAEKVNPGASFDSDDEVLGAFKTIQANPKDSSEMIKSKAALRSGTHMTGRVSLSQIDFSSIKKRRA